MSTRRDRRAALWETDLAAAQSAQPSYDIARGAARLSASLVAVGAASTGIASASVAGAATKSSVTHGLAAKAIAMLALSGAVVTIDARAPVAPPVSPVALALPAVAASAPAEVVVREPIPRQTAAAPATAESAPASVSARQVPVPTARKRGSDRFGRELADVASARALLAADPSAALAAADKPQGSQTLAEDREIIAIRALVSLGRMAEAKARAQDFLARRPASPFAPSARRLLSQ